MSTTSRAFEYCTIGALLLLLVCISDVHVVASFFFLHDSFVLIFYPCPGEIIDIFFLRHLPNHHVPLLLIFQWWKIITIMCRWVKEKCHSTSDYCIKFYLFPNSPIFYAIEKKLSALFSLTLYADLIHKTNCVKINCNVWTSLGHFYFFTVQVIFYMVSWRFLLISRIRCGKLMKDEVFLRDESAMV